MNNTYFNKDIFKDTQYDNKNYNNAPQNIKMNIPFSTTIENILNQSKGKQVIIHITLQNRENKDLKGIIEQSNNEYIIISEPPTGTWQLIPMRQINYISFDENINYQ